MAEMSDDKVFTTEFSLDWAEKGNLAALPGFTIKSLRTLAAEVRRLQAENARLRPEAEKPSPPRRAVEIDLHVGANNWADAVRELVETAAHIEDHGPQCSSVAGSPSSNHIVTVYQDPTMTHERYFEALDRYLAAREAAEKGVGR